VTVLHAENVSYDIAGRSLVSNIDLACESGQFVALLGANGAGKSTLIRMLSGLERPSRGQVRLDARPIRAIDRRVLARRRAYIPQNARVEWPVAVERLVALGLMPQLPVFGDLDRAAWRKVEVALALCDLSHKTGQPATTLSGGELARAMLARALVGEPEIVIADEPLSGLDPRHAMDGVARLAALARAGRLVIASIHDLTLAARYATHVAIMRGGRLLAYGPTASTLTSSRIRAAFDVDACVQGTGAQAIVDFIARPDQPALHPFPGLVPA